MLLFQANFDANNQPSQCFLYDACTRGVLPADENCPLNKYENINIYISNSCSFGLKIMMNKQYPKKETSVNTNFMYITDEKIVAVSDVQVIVAESQVTLVAITFAGGTQPEPAEMEMSSTIISL